MVARLARTSETGIATQIPKAWSSKKYGNIHRHGRRHPNCRSAESAMAVLGWPMDWKYVVETTFRLMHHSMQLASCRSEAASWRKAMSDDDTKQATIA